MCRALLVACFSTALVAGLAAPAGAQLMPPGKPIGLPVAGGVPYDNVPYPDWLTDVAPLGAAPGYGKLVDDPRWRGAVSITHGGGNGGAEPNSEFRALYQGGFAYLSWTMKSDPRVVLESDQLYVAFAHPDGNGTFPSTLVVFTLKAGGAKYPVTDPNPGLRDQPMPRLGTDPTPLVDVEVFSGTSAQIAAVDLPNNKPAGQWPRQTPGSPGSPAWARNNTIAWVENVGAAGKWTISMKVPLVTGNLAMKTFPQAGIPVDANNNFRMWYQFANVVGSDASGNLYQPSAYPRGSVLTNPDDPANPGSNSVLIPVIKDATGQTAWADYHLRQPGDAPTLCRDDGISLDALTVGVKKNGAITQTISAVKPTPMTPNPISENRFVASPKNGGPAIPAGPPIAATFRVANWGSTPASAFQDEALWRTVGPGAFYGLGIPQNGSAELENVWQAPASDTFLSKFLTGERYPHQCVLVELSSTNNGLFFVNRSVYRNMDLASASRFERTAQISVAGLAAVRPDAKTRDVFMYVHTAAMPPVVGAPAPPPAAWPAPLPTPPGRRSVPVSAKPVPPKEDPPKGPDIRFAADNKLPIATDVRIERGREPNPEKLATPTYTVYAWHDTGKTIRLNGATMKVVESQTSFGYFVSHDGPLYGWQHALKGAKQIGPDFYVVSPPTGGSVDIVTEIEAVETGPNVLPCCPPGYGPVIGPRYERRHLLFRRWR